MGSPSFGLTHESRENLILEPFFLLIYYSNFSWQEYYNMPIYVKEWYLGRLSKELKESDGASEAKGSQSPNKQIELAKLKKMFGGGDSK